MSSERAWRRAATVLRLALGCSMLPWSATHAQSTAPAAGAHRVISLIPSVTDLIIALGARDRLVGRTTYDDGPEVASLPAVGGALDPSLEQLISLHPDLVFLWRESSSAELGPQLARAGVHSEVMGTETLEELRAALHRLGQLLALESRADSLGRAIADTLTAVRRSMARPEPVAVLYLLGTNPPFAAGPGTFIDDVITAAGGRNVFRNVGVNWPQFSVEALLEHEPDVIVWPRVGASSEAAAALARLPGWSKLAAVRAGRVLAVREALFNRPGPRIGEAARTLARGILELEIASHANERPSADTR